MLPMCKCQEYVDKPPLTVDDVLAAVDILSRTRTGAELMELFK